MKLISVIVPVYNASKYLNRCIDSILAQTYTNLEVILVDDGSTDESPAICDSYGEKDNRVKVVHKENGGVSSARNAGLKVASGEYVAFVDCDDSIDSNMYELLAGIMEKEKVDLVICDNYRHENNKITTKSKRPSGMISKEIIKDRPMLISATEINICAPWNKLYKRALIDFEFDTNVNWGEDQLFNYKYISKIDKMYYLDKQLYHYYVYSTSLSYKAHKDYIKKSMLLVEDRQQFIRANDLGDDETMQGFYWSVLKPVFAGYYYERTIDKKTAKQHFLEAKNLEVVKETLANFKPQGMVQKIVLRCVRKNMFWLMTLLFKIRGKNL